MFQTIRAGAGIYHDLMGSGLIRLFDASALGLSTSLSNPAGQLNFDTAPRLTSLNDIPAALITPAPPAVFPVRQPNNFAITNSLDDRLKTPYSINLNFSVQREFSGGLFIQASYVSRLSRRSLTSEDIATPANIKDPASGMDYFTAAQLLVRQFRAGVPTAQVQKIPYWENMFPGIASAALTATQVAYNTYRANGPDSTSALETLDRFASPSASRLGAFAYFSPQYSYLRVLRSVGNGNYHAMQWTVRKRFRNGDQIDFNYSLAKSIDTGSTTENNSDSSRGVIINPFNRRLHRSVSDYDSLHNWNANWVYGLPFGKGHRLMDKGKALDALIGGWQLSGIYRHSSGLPISVGNGRFWPTNYNITGWADQIAPVVAGTNRNAARPTTGGSSGANIFQDPSVAIKAFDNALPGEVGLRNNIRGDGFLNLDVGLGKKFALPWKEGHSIQFRWEVFNVLNNVRFDVRSISLDLGNASSFGKYSDTLTPPRVMQFGLRYDF